MSATPVVWPAVRSLGLLLRANLGPVPVPLHVNLAVTHRCQSRCRTCFVWQAAPEAELSLDDYRRFFAANSHLALLTVTGGEPFLRPDLVEVLAAAVEHCRGLYYLHVTTNGLATDATLAAVERLLVLPVHRVVVVVSLDGPRAVHDRVRGGEGFFDRSLATYRGLRAHVGRRPGVELYAGMTLSGENLGALGALHQELEREVPGFLPQELNANLAARSAHYYRNSEMDLSFAPAAAEELAAHFARLRASRRLSRNRLENAYHRYAKAFARTGRSPVPCRAADVAVHLDPAGTVYPCHIDSTPIGRIQDHGFSLGALAQTPAFEAARERVRAGRCAQCWTPCGAYDSLLAQAWRLWI